MKSVQHSWINILLYIIHVCFVFYFYFFTFKTLKRRAKIYPDYFVVLGMEPSTLLLSYSWPSPL